MNYPEYDSLEMWRWLAITEGLAILVLAFACAWYMEVARYNKRLYEIESEYATKLTQLHSELLTSYRDAVYRWTTEPIAQWLGGKAPTTKDKN